MNTINKDKHYPGGILSFVDQKMMTDGSLSCCSMALMASWVAAWAQGVPPSYAPTPDLSTIEPTTVPSYSPTSGLLKVVLYSNVLADVNSVTAVSGTEVLIATKTSDAVQVLRKDADDEWSVASLVGGETMLKGRDVATAPWGGMACLSNGPLVMLLSNGTVDVLEFTGNWSNPVPISSLHFETTSFFIFGPSVSPFQVVIILVETKKKFRNFLDFVYILFNFLIFWFSDFRIYFEFLFKIIKLNYLTTHLITYLFNSFILRNKQPH